MEIPKTKSIRNTSMGFVFDVHSGAQIPCNILTPASAVDIAKAVLLEPYDGGNKRYAGRTKFEAMFMRLADEAVSNSQGATAAAKELLDRILGKPKQQVETFSVTATLEDFLTQLHTGDVGDVGDDIEDKEEYLEAERLI